MRHTNALRMLARAAMPGSAGLAGPRSATTTTTTTIAPPSFAALAGTTRRHHAPPTEPRSWTSAPRHASHHAMTTQRRGMASETPKPQGVPRGATLPTNFNNARASGIRAFLLSPGVIADPYRGPRPWPSPSSFLGTSGWKALVRMVSRPMHDVLTLGQCQSIKGFTRDNFKAEASQLYRQISQLIAEKHVTPLRHLVTEKALTEIKREAKSREKAGWGRIVWEVRDLDKPATLQGRMIFPNPNDTQMAFAQITVGFKSYQRYAAYDGKGRLVAGDPDKYVPVEVSFF